MKLHRFIGNFDIQKASLKVQDGELLNQIRNVLRLEKREEVLLGDGNLNEARAGISEFGRDFVGFEILERWQNNNEPERDVVLYCSILKRENFELVVQKATEAGVKEIVPIITERTVKLNIRPDRLQKIIKEAAEQSGRGIVPVLREPVDFEEAINKVDKGGLNLFFDQSGDPLSPGDLIPNKLVAIFVGPEGGWTEAEPESARKSDFKIVNLGKLTLRAETAAIIATYLTIHNL